MHISSDITRMNMLSAAARSLTQKIKNRGIDSSEDFEQLDRLANESQFLIISIESWTSELNGVWKPKTTDPHDLAQPHEMSDPSNIRVPGFPCPRVLGYDDIWLAYKLNCHCASQIVLRESLVDIIRYRAISRSEVLVPENPTYTEAQRHAVDRLSGAIIQSYPSLLGFTHKHTEESHSPLQGRMAGRLFSIFPMWVIHRAKLTSDVHKQTALEVIK